jgi:hypothetical protein
MVTLFFTSIVYMLMWAAIAGIALDSTRTVGG